MSTHPEPQLLAAFVDGNLRGGELEPVAAHLRDCEECRLVIGEAARFDREEKLQPKRTAWPAWLALAAAAAIVAVFVAPMLRRDPLRKLIAVTSGLPNRPVESRLSGFPWSPRPAVTRTSVEATDARLLQARGEAARILLQLDNRTDAKSLHARAVAQLIAGDARGAVAILEGLTQLHSDNATYWNDLAASRLALAAATADTEGYTRALAAADRAIGVDQSMAAAHFNRGLALEALRLRAQAVDAYERAVALDGASDWGTEARERLARLRTTTRRDAWSKALPALEAAASAGDDAAVKRIVQQFPEESRTWTETEFLGDWADAALAGDDERARKRLDLALRTSAALRELFGEGLLSDVLLAQDDMLLARAHSDYRRARKTYATRRVGEARELFTSAAAVFDNAGSPFRFLSRYYTANALTDLGRLDEAQKELDIAAGAPARYRALHAHVLWQRATIAARRGRYYEAAQGYGTAASAFDAIANGESAATMRLSAFTALSGLGRHTEAWALLDEVFEQASHSGRPGQLQAVLTGVARWEARRGEWAVVASLLSIVTTEDVARENPRLWADSFVWLARARHELGDPRHRDEALRRAEAIAASMPDEAMRDETLADVWMARAACIEDHTKAIPLLDAAESAYRRRDNRFRLTEVLAQRGRSWRLAGKTGSAARDLHAAIALIEDSTQSIDERTYRGAFTMARRDTFDEMVALLDESGEDGHAANLAERSRARKSAAEPVSIEAARERLTPDVQLVAFHALPDRLLIDVLSLTGFRHHRAAIGREELRQKTLEFAKGVSRAEDVASNVLFTLLFGSMEWSADSPKVLVIVPDPAMRGLPFGALATSNQYLAERAAIVVAPSIGEYLRRASPAAPAAARTLIVRGNDRNFRPLPSADDEVAAVAARRTNAVLLAGSDASAERVLAELRKCSDFHYSGHAFVNESDARLSHLFLTPTPLSAGALYLGEITGLVNPHLNLVYLAGCETAVASGRDADPESLANAFLIAGARNAIGSLWKVDDAVAAEFARRFYDEMARGATPASAVQSVQLQMMHSGDKRLAAPSAWAAMQVYGKGM